MNNPNPLTPDVFANIEATARQTLVLHLPREHANPILAAARLAFDAGLARFDPPSPPAAPFDPSKRVKRDNDA